MTNKLWRVGDKEVYYIKEAIEEGLSGKFNQKLEEEFAKKFGLEYAIAVNSGTSALHATVAALGIKEGDEIIVPALTFAATGFSPLYVGATPVFADADPNTFNISVEDIKRKITSKTKAIIPVALYGLPSNLEEIVNIAHERNIKVIEDNAQCYLGKINGKLAGTFGDIAIFSFQRSKHITTGDGGIAITNDEKLAERFRKFSDLGYTTLTAKVSTNENFKDILRTPEFERHELVGYNFRMPEVCAAMALAQLEKLEWLVERRQKIGEKYREVLEGINWIIPQKTPEGYVNSYFTFAMLLDTSKVPWKIFQKEFVERGGDPFYAAWKLTYQEPAIRERFSHSYCPTAERLQPRLIQLKTNFGTEEKIKEQTNALRKTIEYFET